eukprot:gene1629-3160_t
MFPSGVSSAASVDANVKSSTTQKSWLEVGKSYNATDMVVMDDEVSKKAVPESTNQKFSDSLQLESKQSSSKHKKKSKKHKRHRESDVDKRKKKRHSVTIQPIAESSDFSSSEDEKSKNETTLIPYNQEIIYLPNGRAIISQQKKTDNTSSNWTYDRRRDNDMLLFEGSYRLDIPEYNINYNKTNIISSNKIAKLSHKLPSGLVKPTNKDIQKDSSSAPRSKRYFGMEAIHNLNSNHIKRWRSSISKQIKRELEAGRASEPDQLQPEPKLQLKQPQQDRILYFKYEGSMNMIPLPPHVEVEVESMSDKDDMTYKTDAQMIEAEALSLSRSVNSRTHRHPEDPYVWLEAVTAQEDLIRLQKLSAGAKPSIVFYRMSWNKAVTERQMSILEEGIRYIKKHQHEHQHDDQEGKPTATATTATLSLLFKYLLRIAEASCDHETVKTMYERAVEECPASIELRLDQMTLPRKLFASSAVPKLRKLYPSIANDIKEDLKNKMAAYNLSRSMICDSSISTSNIMSPPTTTTLSMSLEILQIDLLSELCRFEYSTGFDERAIALIQALLEVHIGRNTATTKISTTNTTSNTFESIWNRQVELLGEYWDSEYPRIGEQWKYTSTSTSASNNNELPFVTTSNHHHHKTGIIEWQQAGCPSDSSSTTSFDKGNWGFGWDDILLQLHPQDSTSNTNTNNTIDLDMTDNGSRTENMMAVIDSSIGESTEVEGKRIEGYDGTTTTTMTTTTTAAGSEFPATNEFLASIEEITTEKYRRSSYTNELELEVGDGNNVPIDAKYTTIENADKEVNVKNVNRAVTHVNVVDNNELLNGNHKVADDDIDKDIGKDIDNNGNDEEERDEDILVYSRLHGYRIPLRKEDSGLAYKKILGDLKDLDEDELTSLSAEDILKKYAVSTSKKSLLSSSLLPPPAANDVYVNKWEKEELLSTIQWRPLRPLAESDAEEAENQPYRVVLIEDVKPFLFHLSTTYPTYIAQNGRLVVRALQSLGLYIPYSQCSHCLAVRREVSQSLHYTAIGSLSELWGNILENRFKDTSTTLSVSSPLESKSETYDSIDNSSNVSNVNNNDNNTSSNINQSIYQSHSARRQMRGTDITPLLVLSTSNITVTEFSHQLQSFRSTIRGFVQRWQEMSVQRGEVVDMTIWLAAVEVEVETTTATAAMTVSVTGGVGQGQGPGHHKEALKVCVRAIQALYASITTNTTANNSPINRIVSTSGALQLHWTCMRLKLGLPVGRESEQQLQSDISSHTDNTIDVTMRKKWTCSLDVIVSMIRAELVKENKNKDKDKKKKDKKRKKDESSSNDDIVVVLDANDVGNALEKLHVTAKSLLLSHKAKELTENVYDDIGSSEIDCTPSIEAVEAADDIFKEVLFMNFSSNNINNNENNTNNQLQHQHQDSCKHSIDSVLFYVNTQKILPEGIREEGMEGGIEDIIPAAKESRLVALERLHIARIEFLLYILHWNVLIGSSHCNRRIQIALKDALFAFPLNGVILQTFLAFEGQLSGGYIRIKSYLNCVSKRTIWGGGMSALEKIFEICIEIDRNDRNAIQSISPHLTTTSTNTHNIQNNQNANANEIKDNNDKELQKDLYSKLKILLERAFEEPKMRDMPILWQFYIQMEIKYENYENAKRIFLRAIQSCSYCKRIWIQCYGPLRRCFSEKELKSIMKVMEEKGLHIRTEE